MLSLNPGTLVPKSLDSPQKPQNFNVAIPGKAPITAITLTYLDEAEWEVIFFRDRKTPKKFNPSIDLATRLTKTVLEFKFYKFLEVSPELRGWTAYIDRAVYPPPKARRDGPQRDAFGVPYNDHPCRCADTRICPGCNGDKVIETYGMICVCEICDGKGDCPYCRPGAA